MTGSSGASIWADEQWSRIRQAIVEDVRAARVAGNVLPTVGPLEPGESFVPSLSLTTRKDDPDPRTGVSVDDTDTLTLSTLQVKVWLRQAQVADPQLAAASVAFRRAASVLARLEDEIVFNGQPDRDLLPVGSAAEGVAEVLGGAGTSGLISRAAKPVPKGGNSDLGENLVAAVSATVGDLEGRFQTGPFACVLGANYFKAVQSPNNSLVLPQDRILPFLQGGPLVRSPVLAADTGLLIALGGAPIQLVLATDASVEFLQTTPDAWSLFRVYEKMVLRINEPEAVQQLEA